MVNIDFGNMQTPTATDYAYAVAVQPDGKIVVAGTSAISVNGNLSWRIAVARYNANGSLDPTFDADGLQTYDLAGTTRERATAIAAQSNGKIVVVCAEDPNQTPSLTKFTLLRFDAAGALDTFFDTNGVAEAVFPNTNLSTGAAVTLQSDDKAVVAGLAQPTGGNNDFGVARFLSSLPTAAPVSVAGRALTADKRGIRGAIVTLTAPNGETRTTLTGTFGFYRFADVLAGETYILTIRAKRFSFTPDTQILTVLEEIAEADFIGDAVWKF